ncbi:MAG: argonaute/piwi family protein [Candidatus Dormibacteria bacterium]
MRAEILDEPELEFGGGIRHVDPRFGIVTAGPADVTAADARRAIRVGVVAPADQLEGIRTWFERCREPIEAKDATYPNLFPPFPGCDVDVALRTTLVFSERTSRSISPQVLRKLGKAKRDDALTLAVDCYATEIRSLAERGVDVILVGRPEQLVDRARRFTRWPRPADATMYGAATTSDDGEAPDAATAPTAANFHDCLKARVLTIRQPIQIVRRSTWDEATPPPVGMRREDEATRAWNIHVALYYKAGGIPWRLRRESTDLTTCYVGVSFFRSITRDTLDTAVAQVFNERGDGVIVRGGPARVSSEDRQPHLDHDDAAALLVTALDTYRLEHHTQPARVVLHKSSRFTDGEATGFRDAADERQLDALELSWITNSEDARLFRRGSAPPLRGTLLVLGGDELALYTKGSVEFYATYPGMYIPRPIGIRAIGERRSPEEQAREVLALTKMNWNVTRLDGRLPVTLRTANQVKSILRFCSPSEAIATRYAHYM